MANPSALATNGGLIGKSNCASFGMNKITAFPANACLRTRAGTRLRQALLVGGGGGGGKSNAGGGGGGGYFCATNISVCGSTAYPVVIGGGGAGRLGPAGSGAGTSGCNTTFNCTEAIGGG